MYRIFIGVLILLLTACSGASAQSIASPTPLPTINVQALPRNEQGVALVARVNGSEITQPQFERALLRLQQGNVGVNPAALYDSVLDSLIEQVLIEQAAADLQIVVNDTQIETELQASKNLAASETAWQSWLKDNLYTEAEFRDSLRANLIANAMLAHVTANLPQNVLQVRARHILVGSESEANDILARLQNGEDFAALAAQYSKDVTTRERGGDLGWFMDGELLEPALSQVAFAIAPGEIAGPVVTGLGYHVIQTLERAEQPLPEERRPLLVQITFEKWLQGLSYNAVIERYLEE